MRTTKPLIGLLFILSLATTGLIQSSIAQQAAPDRFEVKAHYLKNEYQLAMRDGTKLFTSVYLPRDQTRKYPIMMLRTPYSVAPYGANSYRSSLGPSDLLMKEGFIFVYQDVRGRNMSEGDFNWMNPFKPAKRSPSDADESTDTWDTIEWLLKNIPNHNGRVGMWGISYPGHYAAQALIDPHPALKAVSPQAPMADNWLGDDMHHNGAFFLPHAFNFIISFGRPRSGPEQQQGQRFDHGTNDGYRFFLEMGSLANANKLYMKDEIKLWNEWMEHGDYDEYWQKQNVPQHLKKVTPAVMTVGGWFDAEDVYGPVAVYSAIEKNNPKAWNVLVQGPWCHGCWSRGTGERLGGAAFGSSTSEFYRVNIEYPFFMHFLKEKGEMKLPEAYVFETGSNVWKAYTSWPPVNTSEKSLFFHEKGRLSYDAPARVSGPAYDEYLSDPSKPVPYLNELTSMMKYEYMTSDQRFAATRPDVLVYQTEVLTEDVTVVGPIKVNLFASTSGTDSDFVVKLIDLYPTRTVDPMDGYQMLIRGEPMRAKYRKSWSRPEPLKANAITSIPFTMPDINHTFRKGHRIMIHVQSSWFPLVDRNPQQFLNIYQAKDDDFQKAIQKIYRSPRFSSNLTIKVLSK